MRRPTRSVLAALAMTGVAAAASAQIAAPNNSAPTPAADPCAALTGEAVAIDAVTPLGDLRLSDGRLGRLADLDLGVDAITAGRWADHVAAVRLAVAGVQVRADEGASYPDRWGRRPLRLSLIGADGDKAGSIHRRLVERGLARIAPLGEQDGCAVSLLPFEAAARDQKLGLWREPAARLLGAEEVAAIQALVGRFAIIQGEIVSVGERPRRIYLNFGRDFRRDFTATLSPRTARLLEKAGIAPSSLRGKVVRIRGMVAARRAPAIEVTGLGQIEVIK